MSRRSFVFFIILAIIAIALIWGIMYLGGRSRGPSGAAAGAGPGSNTTIGVRTKTAGCLSQNGLPDPQCTPGAVLQGATVDEICKSGYAKGVRDVPADEKQQIYAEYDVVIRTPGEYEVDHLISLELGGSNGIANLWPEPAEPRPGYHEKDMVENYLHDQVCSGRMRLEDAQRQIATNWLAVYAMIKPAS